MRRRRRGLAINCCATGRGFDPRTEQTFLRPTVPGPRPVYTYGLYVCQRTHDVGFIPSVWQRYKLKKYFLLLLV